MTNHMIAVIISAYNEATRIGNVIAAVNAWAQPHELLVVDDGSTDDTAMIAQALGALIIRQSNQGKSAAMTAGVTATAAPIILFCDADLVGLTPQHLDQLVYPVVSGSVEMCVGVRDRGFLVSEFSRRFLPLISGERALKRRVWDAMQKTVSEDDRAQWKVEMAMNYTVRLHNWRLGTVYLRGVRHVPKEEKRGLEEGFKARMETTRDVAEATADFYLTSEGMAALAQQDVIHFPFSKSIPPHDNTLKNTP